MNNTTFDLNKFTNRSQSFKDLITVKSNINYDPQAVAIVGYSFG